MLALRPLRGFQNTPSSLCRGVWRLPFPLRAQGREPVMCVQACVLVSGCGVLCVGAHVHSLCVCSVSCVYRCVCVHVCGVLCVYYMRVCGGGFPNFRAE